MARPDSDHLGRLGAEDAMLRYAEEDAMRSSLGTAWHSFIPSPNGFALWFAGEGRLIRKKLSTKFAPALESLEVLRLNQKKHLQSISLKLSLAFKQNIKHHQFNHQFNQLPNLSSHEIKNFGNQVAAALRSQSHTNQVDQPAV